MTHNDTHYKTEDIHIHTMSHKDEDNNTNYEIWEEQFSFSYQSYFELEDFFPSTVCFWRNFFVHVVGITLQKKSEKKFKSK